MNLRSLFRVSIFLSALLAGQAARAQNLTQLVIINNTGLPDDSVFVTFVGGGSVVFGNVSTGANGNTTPLALSTSYSLQQLYGTVSGAGAGGPTGTVATLGIDTFYNSFIDITAGTKINGGTPTATDPLVTGRFETYINGPTDTQNNVDTSYVDYVSMPLSFSFKNRADGSLLNLPGQPNQVITTPGPTIFNLLTASNVVTPNDARIAANYPVINSSGNVVGNMTGLARVASPGHINDYHDWLSNNTGNVGNTSLIPWLRTNNIPVSVANLTVPAGDTLAGTLFGYSGTAPGQGTSPFASDSGNLFLQNQGYNLVATFSANLVSGLNANETAALAGQGIGNGTSGVKIVGSGGLVGNFSVFITDSQLNAVTGIYGANPQYTVFWETGNVANTTVNSNNLVDRVVGDLVSVINFGMVPSDELVSTHAGNTSTTANLANSIFASGNYAANLSIGNLSTGEYFYLLSLQGNNTEIAKWFGSSIQDNPEFYNSYAGAFPTETDAYTLAYSDRLQGTLNPDVFYNTTGSLSTLNGMYIEITLGNGAFVYTSSVPEPATAAGLLGLAAAGTVWFFRRRKQPRN